MSIFAPKVCIQYYVYKTMTDKTYYNLNGGGKDIGKKERGYAYPYSKEN